MVPGSVGRLAGSGQIVRRRTDPAVAPSISSETPTSTTTRGSLRAAGSPPRSLLWRRHRGGVMVDDHPPAVEVPAYQLNRAGSVTGLPLRGTADTVYVPVLIAISP